MPELNNVCACATFGTSMFWTQTWAILSNRNYMLCKPVISSMKIVAWAMLLVVDCGLRCCFKRPFEDVGAVHVCERSVQLESFRLTAYFCKTVYSVSIFLCYWEIIRMLVKIILDLDWLMHLNIKWLIHPYAHFIGLPLW